MRKCVDPKYGGCGKIKTFEAFEVSKTSKSGSPEYRVRCKICMRKWKRMTNEERQHMRLPRIRTVASKGEKVCYPPERGGCGKILPETEFHLSHGYRKPRCRQCTRIWKAMTREEREPFIPKNYLGQTIRFVKPKPPAPVSYRKEDNYFFHISATNCGRKYWEIGREIV